MSAAEWIAKRRELLADATEGPWAPWLDQDGASHMGGLLMVGNAAAVIPEGEAWIDGAEINPVAHVYTPEDRALIADARTSLPLALHALEAVLDRARKIVDEHGDRVYQDNAFAVGAHAAAVAILDDLNAALEAKP